MTRFERFLALRRPRVKRTFMLAVVGVLLLLGLALFSLYRTLTAGLPDVERLGRYQPPETSRIFAQDGTLVATLFDENRTWVKLSQISPYVVKALTSIEDARFFEHGGVDVIGVVRALVANVAGGEVDQGASTLTMQLSRQLFLSDERTLSRKVQEAILARRLENRFDKDQILELYLNEVYFGAGAYGIDSAANRYFHKEPSDLTSAEAAMLAGLLQAPSELNPFEDPKAARDRQRTVLDRMRETGVLEAGQHRAAVVEAEAMRFEKRDEAEQALLKFPYFTQYVIREASLSWSERLLRRGGLQIHTSLDLGAQRKAEEILTRMIEARGPDYGASTAALVLVDNASGHIRAMVGGPGWTAKNRFNRAWQARRQPGSAFKPILYAAALESGMTPETEIADEKVVFYPDSPDEWTPRNSDGAFMGRIPLRAALMYSRNIVAVRLLNDLGIGKVTALAGRMGMEGPFPPYLSLALGSGDASPLEMAEAFATFPSGGLHRPARATRLVKDPAGNVVQDLQSLPSERVLSPSTAAGMVEMLQRAVARGTGTAAALGDRPVGGKTGTTNDYRDAWFVGFTPEYTMAVWMGNDDNSPMADAYGGGLPAEIWREVMTAVEEGKPVKDFTSVQFHDPETVTLCADSHYVAGPRCPRKYQDQFRTSWVPHRDCPIHSGAPKPSPSPSGSPSPGVSPSPVASPSPTAVASPEPAPSLAPKPYPTATTTPSAAPRPTPPSAPSPAWEPPADPTVPPAYPKAPPRVAPGGSTEAPPTSSPGQPSPTAPPSSPSVLAPPGDPTAPATPSGSSTGDGSSPARP